MLPGMIELFKKNRMRPFSPFYDNFFYRKFALTVEYFILQYYQKNRSANVEKILDPALFQL